jgi:lysyl-tRNA synthetase class 2
MILTNSTSIQDVLFFPQMRPEKKARVIELNDDEKQVLTLLKDRMELNTLKADVGLSNKKWDKSIKNLREMELINVEKTDDGLFIEKLEQ